MDKRVLLTVGLCMLVLIVWTRFFAPSPPATTPTGSSQAPAAASAPSPGTPPGVPPATGTSSHGPVAPGAATPSKPAAQTRVIEQKGYYRATFTSWGAA